MWWLWDHSELHVPALVAHLTIVSSRQRLRSKNEPAVPSETMLQIDHLLAKSNQGTAWDLNHLSMCVTNHRGRWSASLLVPDMCVCVRPGIRPSRTARPKLVASFGPLSRSASLSLSLAVLLSLSSVCFHSADPHAPMLGSQFCPDLAISTGGRNRASVSNKTVPSTHSPDHDGLLRLPAQRRCVFFHRTSPLEQHYLSSPQMTPSQLRVRTGSTFSHI